MCGNSDERSSQIRAHCRDFKVYRNKENFWFESFLLFCINIPCSDETTSDEIARFRYTLASYRMLLQVRNESTTNHFGQANHWQTFLTADDDHASYFDQLCTEGRIDEAKILFTRYPELAEHLNSLEAIEKLFFALENAIAGEFL